MWRTKVFEKSSDEEFFSSAKCFFELLNKNNVKYAVIGSVALQSYSMYIRRVPSDIDIIIQNNGLEFIRENFNDLVQKKGYYKLLLNNIKIHIIVESFDILYKDKSETLFSINLDGLIDYIYLQTFKFMTIDDFVLIPVPRLEYLIALTLLKPLDSNSINDIKEAIDNNYTDCNYFANFVNQHKYMNKIITYRLDDLFRLISNKEPKWKRDYKLLTIIETLKEHLDER